MQTLTVSRSTARFIQQGHPWVRIDKFTRGLGQLKSGQAVTLIDENKKTLASALADPDQDICARVYHRLPHKHFDINSALQRALDKRQSLINDPATNCFRLVHGEADFLPGLRIELLGEALVILLRAPCIKHYLPAIIDWCRKQFPDQFIVIKEHMEDLQKNPLRCYGPEQQQLDSTTEIIGRELGTQVLIQPCADLATGIYVDQRENRAFLRQHCAGKRIANAFAYTGLFSSSLLLAGAATAVDIDIAAPSLETAQKNAALNHVADKHQVAVTDSIRFFKNTSDEFDIIILDPPTAAHGKGGDQWILRKHYPQLLDAAFTCLAADGLLLACCNTIAARKQFRLGQHIEQHFPQLKRLTNPAMGIDIPALKGFPESSPYQLLIAQKSNK